MKLGTVSEGEVWDLEGEMNQFLEDISIGLILDDEETLETKTETDLLGTETEPPPKESGGATEAVASLQCTNINGERGRGGGGEPEQRHNSGYPCQGLPILTTNATCCTIFQLFL